MKVVISERQYLKLVDTIRKESFQSGVRAGYELGKEDGKVEAHNQFGMLQGVINPDITVPPEMLEEALTNDLTIVYR